MSICFLAGPKQVGSRAENGTPVIFTETGQAPSAVISSHGDQAITATHCGALSCMGLLIVAGVANANPLVDGGRHHAHRHPLFPAGLIANSTGVRLIPRLCGPALQSELRKRRSWSAWPRHSPQPSIAEPMVAGHSGRRLRHRYYFKRIRGHFAIGPGGPVDP